jgi:hypothetical protein
MAAFIRELPTGVFFAMLALAAAMTALAVYVGLRTRARIRLLAETPTALVAAAGDGRRAFEGRAEALEGASLAAPLTGAACCWYEAKVERYVPSTSTDKTGSWRTVRAATSSEPFLLRDASGACVVLPDGAEVTPTDRSLWHGTTLVPSDKNPPRVGPGESAQGMLRIEGFSGGYRYSEARIHPGDPLLALGDFTAAPWDADDVDEGESEAGGAEEDEEASGSGTEDEAGEGYEGDAWSDLARLDAFLERAARVTPRRLQRTGSLPFLLSTTPRAKLAEVQGVAWKGALGLALVPAALAALLLWLRFG